MHDICDRINLTAGGLQRRSVQEAPIEMGRNNRVGLPARHDRHDLERRS
jgi:hypothetical protein